MRLTDFAKEVKIDPMSVVNVDDIFNALRRVGATEVTVNTEQMGLIVQFYLCNAAHAPENGKILREGKLDKFMGIKLVLE